jgi:flavin reductase (DIM6/NTAB) family NADH-FMN oxidoreductase RutF
LFTWLIKLNKRFMQHITPAQVQDWSRFYRANFINCLSGFKSASLIGTANKAGQTNLAIFSNIVHLGADPALVGFVNRPREAAPHTLANIEATRFYTINHISATYMQQAHQTSAKYPADESEFDATGLTPVYKAGLPAPFVAESNIQYAMELVEVLPIRHNSTFLVIGTVKDIFIDENCLSQDGYLYLERAGSVASLGIDGYYEPRFLNRFEYAKPGTETRPIAP